MYAVNLMRLARLAGLSQSDIARHLGIVRVQPNIWALGKRPIAEDKVAPLVAFIARAVKKRLAIALPGETLVEDMAAALSESVEENCQRYGYESVANIETYVTKLEAYTALTQRHRHQKTKLEEDEHAAAGLHFWLKLQVDLLPIMRLLSDEEQMQPAAHTEGVKTTKPRGR